MLLPIGSFIYNLKTSTGAFEQSATASRVFFQNKARLKDFCLSLHCRLQTKQEQFVSAVFVKEIEDSSKPP
ncbi:hypothetical protein STRDD11_01216 [Streptococcus sp. DD11]|nr:hypothetical protein STRDD11_01216 [Streptococcus sp. DD11]